MTLLEKEEQEQAAANALWQRGATSYENTRRHVQYQRVHRALTMGRDWFHGPTHLVNAEPEYRNDPVSLRYTFKVGLCGDRLVYWMEYYDELNYWDREIGRHTCGVYQQLHILPEALISLYRAMFPDAPDAREMWPWNTI